MSLYLEQITEPLLIQSYTILFCVSFILCIVIILSSGYGFSRRSALDETAIQSAHKGFVPRAGGLAIYISIFALIPLLSFGFIPLSVVFEINASEITWLILSTVPVFSIGIIEDLGYSTSPRLRLIASTVSSILALFIFKVWISKLDIPGIDTLLMLAPIGIIFTIFATVGVVNAFNLIDGLNGLSAYVTVTIAFSLSIIAFNVGNIQITIFLSLVISASLGFMIFNFPFGKIFLGDGGAYTLGHLLVWSAILLINHATEVSAFAILLIFFWPVADTGLAIWRRWKLGNPTDRPDRLHFHQLAMRFLEIRFFGRDRRHLANPIATLILVPFISVPQILGVLFWNDFTATVWFALSASLLFTVTYIVGVKTAKRSRSLSG